jgi:hypothetical protein
MGSNQFYLKEESYHGIAEYKCCRCEEFNDAMETPPIVKSRLEEIPQEGIVSLYRPVLLKYTLKMYCPECVNDCGCPKKQPLEDTK